MINPQTLNEQIAFFRENGYAPVESAVSDDVLDALQRAVARIQQEHLPERNLLATDSVFETLIDGHTGFALLEQLLGEDIQLLSLDLRACPPDGGAIPWHVDLPFFSGGNVVSVNTALYLDDLTPQNGALRVLPRSHLVPFSLRDEEQSAKLPGEVLIECKAGTMVVFSDCLWHRTGDNTTELPRRGIFTYYGHYWQKPCAYAENPLPFYEMRSFIEGRGPKRAQLLGWLREGSEYNPPAAYVFENRSVNV